jgi:hypothetical protein
VERASVAAVQDDGGDPVGVLLEGEQLGAEAEVAAEVLGGLQQDGFEVVLAAQAPGGGADPGGLATRVDVPEEPVVLGSGERRGLHDAVVVGQDGRRLADRGLHSGGAVQLHRADVVPPPARVVGGPRMLLDEQVADLQTAQEQ